MVDSLAPSDDAHGDVSATVVGDDRPPWQPELALPRGSQVGRYVVLSRLGAGAMGLVVVAYDPELDRKLALKLLHPRDDRRAQQGQRRLLAEAQALARLSDPNVVAVHDVGMHEGRVFVAMELVAGRTLKHWIAEAAHPWLEALDVMTRAGRGLAAAHAQGLVHRDFKPENVMLGDDGRVRVMDFGLARAEAEPPTSELDADVSQPRERALDLGLTQVGAVVGTPAYMAPEQLLGGRGGPAADQFSFCTSLWEALYGQRPFVDETLPGLQARILRGEITRPPAGRRVPRWLRRVVERGLAVDPALRWPSMQALLSRLERGRTRARWFRGLAAAGALVLAVGRRGGLAALAGAPPGARMRGRGGEHHRGLERRRGRGDLGLVSAGQGRFEEARALHEEALALRLRALGPEHPTVANTLNNLAIVLESQKRYDEAIPLLERAGEIWAAKLGPGHPDVALGLTNLALVQGRAGRTDEAEALYRRSLALWEAAVGPEHPDLAKPLQGLASIAIERGRPVEAVPLAQRAARLREAAGLGPDQLGPSHFTLAKALWDANQDRPHALALAHRALAEHRERGAAGAEDAAAVEAWLAERRLPSRAGQNAQNAQSNQAAASSPQPR